MIKIKDSGIMVACHSCQTRNHIDMILKTTYSETRTLGVEYEHTYNGQLICPKCGTKMLLETMIYEYPIGFLNYSETFEENCTFLSKDFFIITEDIPQIKFLNIDNDNDNDNKEIISDEIKKLLIDCSNFIEPYNDGGNDAERLIIRLNNILKKI